LIVKIQRCENLKNESTKSIKHKRDESAEDSFIDIPTGTLNFHHRPSQRYCQLLRLNGKTEERMYRTGKSEGPTSFRNGPDAEFK
jgi:hypothetical protein